MSIVELSSGASWNPQPHHPPYLLASPGQPWPDGTAWAVFTDSTGGELLTVDLEVTPDAILASADPEEVAPIPAGANFEILLEHAGAVDKIRYGKVVRREARFSNAPATQLTNQALKFVDTFPTLGLRTNWKAVAGRTKVFDNSGSSLANGVGPNVGLLFAESAIRWDTPLNGDSVAVNVNLLNQGTGKARVILCADQRFTTYLGVEFEENAHKIHLCTGTDPVTVTYRGSEITNTVADNDNYTVRYNEGTDTISVYKGASTSPLGSWEDTTSLVPHGPGYRYAGLAWVNSGLLSQGIQVSFWQAKDDV